MRVLGQVEMRCQEHERFQPTCAACCFLRKAEHDLVSLRTRGDQIFRQLKQRLATRELIMIDLR